MAGKKSLGDLGKTLYFLTSEHLALLRNHPLHVFCALLAVLTLAGEVYILLQARRYGAGIALVLPAGSSSLSSSSDSSAGGSDDDDYGYGDDNDNDNDNDTTTDLRNFFLWFAIGITVVAGLNIVFTLFVLLRREDWRNNAEGGPSVWRWVLMGVLLCYWGLTAGIVPMVVDKGDASGMAAFVILVLYLQTMVWALVLAWRDVRSSKKGMS